MKDLKNKRFDKLLVLERDSTPRKDKHIYWKCQCDCNRIITVRSTLLTMGKKTSCGCDKGYYQGKIIDLSNQQIGQLLVLYPIDKRSGSHVMWHCRCKCGNKLDIDGHSLRKGLSLSCGCTKISKGEHKIEEILKENNISFEREKVFDNCRFPDTNALLKFDFYANNEYLIEYDGKQHFEINNDFWNIEKTKKRDNFKNKWCKDNNITLIRIPYTHYNQLCIKDLLVETSDFIKINKI